MAVVGFIVFAFVATQRARIQVPSRVKMTVAALAVCYVLLVMLSNVLAYFVVYARTVKPFVPLFGLLGGWALHVALKDRRHFWPVAILGISVAAAFNFWPHFPRVFPRDIEVAVLRNWENPKRSLSITGSFYWYSGKPVTHPDLALVNNRELYPVQSYVGYPSGQTLMQVNHPLSYLPFQYECHSPRERALIRSQDISIRLIQLSDPNALPDDLPMSMLYRIKDKPRGYEGAPK